MGNGSGKRAGTNSIYCPSNDAVHENTGFALSTFQLHHITALVQDFQSLHDHRFCSSNKQVQKLEFGVQLCSCPECWVRTVCCWRRWPKHKFTGCPNSWKNEMGDNANILLGRPTTNRENPTPNCENGWATSCWPHLDPQFRYIFCGVKRGTKYWSPRLHWPYSNRP